jgi:hypothetical protein
MFSFSILFQKKIFHISSTFIGYNPSFGYVHSVYLTQDSKKAINGFGYINYDALFDSNSKF